MTSTEQTPYEKALYRVEHSAVLSLAQEHIMADWPEGDEHWNWVATAPEREILQWVEDCYAHGEGGDISND